MLIQAPRVVLRQNPDLGNPGVCHIAQDKINRPEIPRNRHCGNRSPVGKLLHTEAVSAC